MGTEHVKLGKYSLLGEDIIMAFESWREINRIRKNHRDAIYFYANLQDRFYTIEENDILPDELNPDDKNLLKAFCDLYMYRRNREE